jgi:enoyl-CoA hydratase/carnithine racemase
MTLVTFQQRDSLGEIVIYSPPLNLFSLDLLADLRTAVDEASASDTRALLVRAEGEDFSAGAEVAVFMGLDESQASDLSSTALSLIAAIEAVPVPTLALIHGQCYAGALETCLACDLIWAAEGSQIGQIEAVAGGITYAGGTQRIASRVGVARAAEMVFTATILPPETLLSWGSSTESSQQRASSTPGGRSLRVSQPAQLAHLPRRSVCCTPGVLVA